MNEIEDPWHSRPIDVHRWSAHPEVVQFVDRVWDELLSSLVFEALGSCSDLACFCGFNSVFEYDACDDFGEIVKAA